MFFVLATAASAITELISRILRKRAKDLERTLDELLAGSPISDPDLVKTKKAVQDAKNQVEQAKSEAEKSSAQERLKFSNEELKAMEDRRESVQRFKETSIWRSATSATKKRLTLSRRYIGPSYLSAKAFAEAVTEMLGNGGVLNNIETLPNLQKRLESLVRESKADLIAVKAGLERWFDETMERLGGAYKRWATLSLFLVGFILAGLLNASTLNVAHDLWKDPVTRQTVADSASKLVQEGAGADKLGTIAGAADKLQQLELPLGWGGGRAAYFLNDWHHWTVEIAGWVLTALLVMLGAPFWFDLLSRLVNLRSTGAKPLPAAKDGTSATGLATSTTPTPPAAALPAGTDWKDATQGMLSRL